MKTWKSLTVFQEAILYKTPKKSKTLRTFEKKLIFFEKISISGMPKRSPRVCPVVNRTNMAETQKEPYESVYQSFGISNLRMSQV